MSTTIEMKEIKHYSTGELASMYKVCSNTMRKWLKPFKGDIGERHGRFYTAAQVKIIFEKLDGEEVIS